MEIVELQAGLTALGLKPGAIDGYAKKGGPTYAAVDKLLERNKHRLAPNFKPTQARKLIAAEQLIYWSAGIEVGAFDGLVGPQVLEARRQWAALKITGRKAEPWRDPIMEPRPSDPIVEAWPRQKDVTKFYGERGMNQATLELPFAMRLDWDLKTTIRKFSIHEKCHDSAARVFARVLSEYGEARISELGLDRFGGCLNVRKMRGGSAWSMHSWGIAIDFYPSKNQLQWGRDRASLAKPECATFWKLWAEEKWTALGQVRNFDWMHVQAANL